MMRTHLAVIFSALLVGCATTATVTDMPETTRASKAGTDAGIEEAKLVNRDNVVLTTGEINALNGINSFFLDVEKQSQSPPAEESLKKLCERKIDKDRYITFITVDDKRALMFALTSKQMGPASESVYLYTRYFKGNKPGMVLRVSAWNDGVTPDWAYIFDRNQDGNVDYIAYMDGPRPVAPVDSQQELPKITEHMQLGQYKLVIFNQLLAFWHVADDNHDGAADGLAMRAYNKDTGWSLGWMVLQSTKFNNALDRCMYISEHNIDETHACEWSYFGRKYEVPGKYSAPSIRKETADEWLSIVNNAARECGFGASSFIDVPTIFPKSGDENRN
jgi:hypothetical protein